MKESTEDLKAKVLEFKKQEAKLEKEILDKRAMILEYEMHIEGIGYKTVVYPENGTEYWCIADEITCYTWDNDSIDYGYFNKGNYYETREKVDLANKWQLLNTQILNTIALINKKHKWVFDREDKGQYKCSLSWSMYKNSLHDNYVSELHHYENNVYMSVAGIEILRTLYTIEEFKFWLTKEK